MLSASLFCCCLAGLAVLVSGVEDHFQCNFDDGHICTLTQDTNDVFDWTVQTGPTPSKFTGPERDFGSGDQKYYIFIESSDPRIVNDNARLSTEVFESGNWMFEFYYHAVGSHIGVLNVFTRAVGSDYHKLVWHHSGMFDNEVANWTQVQLSLTETSNFQVILEGIRSIGPQGDIALDNMIGYRAGPPTILPEPTAFGLPSICTFENVDFCSLVTPYYSSQLPWLINKGVTSSDNTGPSIDHTTGTDQGYYIYTEASTRDQDNNKLAGPGWRGIIATSEFWPECGCFYLDFWYHAYGDSVKRMMVLQEGYDTPLWDRNVTSSNKWTHIRRTFYTTHPTRLLFVGEIGDTHTSDYGLDDIYVEDCGCIESTTPTQSTSTSTTATSTSTSTTTTSTSTSTTTTSTSTSTTSTSTSTSTSTTTIPTTTTTSTSTSTTTPTTTTSTSTSTTTPPTTTTSTTTPTSTSTTTPTTTTLHAQGQDHCDFDLGLCAYVIAEDSGFRFVHAGGFDSSRIPSSDAGGFGKFVFADSTASGDNNIAQISMDKFIENPNSCHSAVFKYSIAGNNPGSLSLILQTRAGINVRALWTTTVSTNQWTQVTLTFRYWGSFRLLFEAKRISNTGGSDFALDDIFIPVTECSDSPLYPPSDSSTATENVNGTETYIDGTVGEIVSPNFPSLYPALFSHKWVIAVNPGSKIELEITYLNTEQLSDMLTATETSSGQVIFEMSGQLSGDAVYLSSSSSVTLTFTSDDFNDLFDGWKVKWREVVPTTTTSTTTSSTTTPAPAYGDFTCSFNQWPESACGLTIDTTTSSYVWQHWSGPGPNADVTGPQSGAGYMVVDSSDSGTSDVLATLTSGEVFNNDGCYVLDFNYLARGPNLGTLVIESQKKDSSQEIVEWAFDGQETLGWTLGQVQVNSQGPLIFKVVTKRVMKNGSYAGGDFAIDYINLSPCTQTTPVTTQLPPNNDITYQDGVTGDIISLNYPDPYTYPTGYTHTWEIRGDSSTVKRATNGKRIQLSVRDFITEQCCDTVTVSDPINGKDIVVLSGNVNAQSFYSSGPEMDVKFVTDDKVAMKGFHMTWYEQDIPTTTTKSTTTSTTTIGPSTTPHVRGQSNCDFESGFCDYKQKTSDLRWQIVTSIPIGDVTSRVPPRDKTTGTGDFAFVDSSSQAAGNIAQMYTDYVIENPNTCHSIHFQYSIAGSNPGSLSLKLQTTSGDTIKQLWSTDTATNDWTSDQVTFRHFDSFKLMFEAKRLDNQGGSDFALDDIAIPITSCSQAPLVPPSTDSTATESNDGLWTDIQGQSGEIMSPDYPSFYPNNFKHTWQITVGDNSTISFTILNFITEPARDILTAMEKDNITQVFTMEGVRQLSTHQSQSNQVTLKFTTDSSNNQMGFRILWEEILPVETTTTVTTMTTTPSSYGQLKCYFDNSAICSMTKDLTTDFQWQFLQQASPNYPNSGPSEDNTDNSANGYMYLNSKATSTNGDRVASLYSPPLYSFLGCHRVQFAYHALGTNLGSLSLSTLQTVSNSDEIVQRWISDTTTSTNWRTAEVYIQIDGEFQLVWIGKRVKTVDGEFGEGDLAIDDVIISECNPGDPVSPSTTPLPLVDGDTTPLSGTSGEIKSKNFPSEYPNLYSHTWDITGDESEKVVSLIVKAFDTEECCDIVVIRDPVDDTVLATFSGSVSVNTIVQSGSNRMTISFGETDAFTASSGFHFTWFLARKPAAPTVAAQVDSTTTLPTADGPSAQITVDDYASWVPILVVCILLVALIIAIIVIVYIRKKNAANSKVSSSQERLHDTHEGPRLEERGPDHTLNTTIHAPVEPHYDVPFYAPGMYSSPPSQTGDSGHYSLGHYDPNNIVTNPLRKKMRSGFHLSEEGQPASGRRKKAKKLKQTRADKYAKRNSNNGIISVPDGTGNTTPEYVNHSASNTGRDPYVEP